LHVFNPRSVGSCNLVLYEKDIPEIYQNFDSIPGVADRDLARAGSSVILADYCPYVQVNCTELVFLNVYGAQESIPRNEFRQPM
jgi:hypothetical protein